MDSVPVLTRTTDLAQKGDQVRHPPVLRDLAVAHPEDALRAPHGVPARGRERHERAVLGALPGHSRRDKITLTDQVVDDEVDVGKGGAEHGEDATDTIDPGRRAGGRAVVDVIIGVEPGDLVELAVVDDLLDEVPI